MRLLVIEDEKELANLVSESLKSQDYDVDVAYSLCEAKCFLNSVEYDVIICDRLLPDGDCLDLIKSLVQDSQKTSILMVSGCASHDDRVKGLECGADDYLIKPFAMKELNARIKNLIRRSAGSRDYGLQAGNIRLELLSNTVTINTHACKLTRREMVLLETLIKRAGQLVSKEYLEKTMYGLNEEGSSGAIDVAVFRLRKTLREKGATAQIHTMRGLGYIFEEDTHAN